MWLTVVARFGVLIVLAVVGIVVWSVIIVVRVITVFAVSVAVIAVVSVLTVITAMICVVLIIVFVVATGRRLSIVVAAHREGDIHPELGLQHLFDGAGELPFDFLLGVTTIGFKDHDASHEAHGRELAQQAALA